MARIHTELTGLEFNAIHKKSNTKFYKFLNDNLRHFNFKYQLGLNVDTVPFKPFGTCLSGGLYFCEESDCHLYWEKYGNKLAVIEIPDDARVYVEKEKDKYKADKIIITKISDFRDVEDSFWANILLRDRYVVELEFIKDRTEDIYKIAVKQDSFLLRHIKNQTSELCESVVKQNGKALRYVNNRTAKICEIAVQQNGSALQYVEDKLKTEKIIILAVEQNGLALEYVKDNLKTEKICSEAVKQDGLALHFVNSKYLTEEICCRAVEQNGLALRYLYNMSSFLSSVLPGMSSSVLSSVSIAKICKLAVQQNGFALVYVYKYKLASLLTEEICILAVKQNGLALQFIEAKYQTEEICSRAVEQNSRALKHVDNPWKSLPREIFKLAVEQNNNEADSGSDSISDYF